MAETVQTAQISVNTETFTCQNCGSIMKFDTKSQMFKCSSCGTEISLETLSDTVREFSFADYAKLEKESIPFVGMAVASCQNCGLEISFSEGQVSAVCPMCGSSQIATAKQKAGIPPEGIVPFKVDKQDAQQKFREWAKSRWFAPNDFKKNYGEGQLTGMYLPFWTYDSAVCSKYSGEGGKKRTVKDQEGKVKTVTDWYPVNGTVTANFDDVLVCATDKEKNVEGILPYNTTQNAKPYSVGYLSGYYAEIYKIKADKAFERGKTIMESEMRSLAVKQIRKKYDEAKINSIKSKFTQVTYKHMLLPLYSSAFGYKGKTYNYLINGETGRVSGDRPYSAAKIAVAAISIILVIAIVVFVSMYMESEGMLYYEWNVESVQLQALSTHFYVETTTIWGNISFDNANFHFL